MTAKLSAWIAAALQLLQSNIADWMAWNLFLALVPLAISFWLFHHPSSRWLRWGVNFLLGVTFFIGIQRYDEAKLITVIDSLRTTYLELDSSYLVGACAITLILMALDILLLQGREVRSLLWWVGFLVFITFLPNAPYVLTDIIHLIRAIRHNYYSAWLVTLVLIPQFFLFMLLGFEAYVLSLIYLGDYLRRHRWGKFILWAELIIHGLSAIGIYLGRFKRFNSWHIITQPDELVRNLMNDLASKFPVLVIAVTFVTIVVLYWIMKQVSLGIMLKSGIDRPSKETSSRLG